LDFKRAGADSFWVELGAAYSDATARDLSFGIWEPWGQIKPDPYDPISRSRVTLLVLAEARGRLRGLLREDDRLRHDVVRPSGGAGTWH